MFYSVKIRKKIYMTCKLRMKLQFLSSLSLIFNIFGRSFLSSARMLPNCVYVVLVCAQ
ncbi:hypothetical protein OIU77_008796 [Salix suchowensis]|uniref:Uncharacterized protein n=1 Tax=Salix suchowensis TaxID=1278906 RepID=A0ABQ9ACZ1_9ROSI|nr:hypothetical protein OIU77_008796 [Salix suchowensis]